MLPCLDVDTSPHTCSIQEDIDKNIILFYNSHELWMSGDKSRLMENVTHYLHLTIRSLFIAHLLTLLCSIANIL